MMKGTEQQLYFSKGFVVGMCLLKFNEIIVHNVNVQVLSILSYKNKKF